MTLQIEYGYVVSVNGCASLFSGIPGTPVSIFVDKGKGNWDAMDTALGNLTRKCDSSSSGEVFQQRLLLEHIFHSVFGQNSCDVPTLRKTLETCSESQLAHAYTEALDVMEQSVDMEDPTSAQQFIRQQLEALSNTLAVDEQDGKSSNENLPVIKQTLQKGDEASLNKSLPETTQSSPALLTFVPPPRNSSYLSRTASTVSSTSLSSIGERNSERAFATDKMNYAQVELKSFDRNRLADAIFEQVRMTAQEFVVEKRKSSTYNSRQMRYLDKKRSSLLSSGNVRDSGLIEDYTEGDKNSPGKLSLKSLEKSSVMIPGKSSVTSEGKSPKTPEEFLSGDFWEKFSEKGFATPKTREEGESLEALANSFRFSGLLSDDEKKELENINRKSGSLHSPSDVKLRRSKSSVSDLSSSKHSLKPPIEPKDSNSGATQDKPNSSRSKKAKKRFLTIGRKGMKIVRGIRRTASQRMGSDFENQVDLSADGSEGFRSIVEDNNSIEESSTTEEQQARSCATDATTDFFDEDSYSRWRTTSLPVKNSSQGKRKDKNRQMNIFQLFPSTNNIPLHSQENEQREMSSNTEDSDRRHSTSPRGSLSSSTVAKSFSFDTLDNNRLDTLNEVETISRSQSNNALLSSRKLPLDDRQQVFLEGDDSRSRMDSGITADKSSDDATVGSQAGNPRDYWEDTGVAGIKFLRRQGLRRNQTNRYSLNQTQGRYSPKKILKLAFVGNDRTIGDMARAYYELRRRQVARAPLLHHIDLRLYYIPIGGNAFADEYGSKQSGCGPFDLEIAEMLGEVDPWYRSVVAMCVNNLVRVCPSINNEDVEDKLSESSEKTWCNVLPTSDNLLANTILSYFRFAVKTCYVPIYRAIMRTSADELVIEVFCCRAEIGHVAFKQAIAAGRFGKAGKLVDSSNDTGPPLAYTLLKYKKFGINGNFIASKTVEETNYYRVCLVPIALSGRHQDQSRFQGADGLLLTSIDNDKRLKLLKRGTKSVVTDEDCSKSRFTVSEAKMEVVRPVQGTFAVCLDHTCIHTNIKSVEISRCLAPEYERLNSRKRKQTNSAARVLSLPIKTFWSNSTLP